MVLLWTNPSPTSTFAPQTIPLDLSKYSAVLIACRLDNSTTPYGGNYLCFIGEITYMTLYVRPVNSIYSRYLTVSTSGITFAEGYTTATNLNNNAMVPNRIYGIKA